MADKIKGITIELGADTSAFENSLDKVSKSLKSAQSSLENAAKKTSGISLAATGAVTALGGLAMKAITASDDLNTYAAQTGFTTAEIQKMQYAADRIDVSMETITGAAAKMTKQLGTSESKFEELGIQTRDANGEFLDTNEIFYNTIQALSEIDNETERDAAAMEIFGKSANQLAGIIDDGGEAFRNLGQEAEDAGLILSQSTLNDLNAVNDEIDKMKAQLTATGAKIGAELLPVVQPVLEKLLTIAADLLAKIGELDSGTLTVIVTILGLVAAITPVITAISAVSGALAFLAANPVVLIIAAIAALVAAFVYLWNNCEEFRNFFINLWEGIKTTVATAIEGIKAIFNAIIDFVKNNWQSLLLLLVNPFAGAFKLLYDNCETFRNFVDNFLNTIKEKAVEIGTAIKEGVESAVQFIKDLPAQALAWGKDLIDNFIGGIKEKWDALKGTLSDAAQTVKDFLGFSEPKKGPLSNFHTYAPDMMELFASGIKDNMHLITDQMNSLGENMSGSIQSSANLTLTTPVYLDGRVIASVVNQQLGVLL